jgi:hypothetical protein
MKGKITALALITILCLSVSAVSSKKNIGVDYVFEPVMVNGQWMIEDTQILEIPGEPLVPYKAASILLPEGAEVKDVKVHHGSPIVQKGFELPWGQEPCTFSGPQPEKVGPNKATYNSNSWYPKKVFEVVGIESFKGFQILNVILYPVQYQPKSQTVKFYPKMTVEVQFGKGMKNKLYRGLAADMAAVADIADNPDVLSTYTAGGTPLATEEYIIITSSTLESTFQELATWKAMFVDGASVYTTTWIYANYTGTDNQMKIRNFIIDKYTNNGTQYVLLGGDTGVVPYRGFYVSTGGYTDTDMAADMYYAHLDGTHNADGDSRYGETNDNVDFYADVAVGRAPVDNTTEAGIFVNKVIEYEQMDKPKRVCFHQSRVQPGNSPDSRCLAYNCDDYIPGDYTIDYLFEENGNISKTDWRNAFNAGPIVVTHIGHGNTTLYHINYEVGGTVNWATSDCSSFANTFFPWTTSVACISGQFEANDCLAEQYVKDDCGAIGALYNDNYGWFSTANACMYSGEFCEMEVRACWDDGYEKLGDLLNRSRYYMASSAQSNSYYRWCFYERNLMGDPETPCLTRRYPQDDTVTITAPTPGEEVSGVYTVTTTVTGDINSVKFYIDDVFKYEDTTAPYTYDWNTVLETNGNHTVKAEGYVSGVYADEDSVTCEVYNAPPPYITITNPPDGSTVSDTVTCAADSNCDSVKWYIDGVFVGEDTSAPFQYLWDTIAYSNGSHTVKAEGYNGGVYKCEDSVTVTVENIPTPHIAITNPPDGSTVSDTVTCAADSNCDSVKWYIDGVFVGEDTSAPFQYLWDTIAYSDGSHTVKAEGYNGGVYQCEDSVTVTVDNITCYITITNPPDGSTVSDTVTCAADSNCDSVKWYIDGVFVGEDTSAPFQYLWDTTAYSNGSHTVKAEGYVSGVYECEDSVTVTVENITYYITITNPPDGSTVSDTVTCAADSNCDSVKWYIDGVFVGEDTSAPFQYLWDTIAYSDGSHTVKAEGYNGGVYQCEDSVTVTVDNIPEPYITITNPANGSTVSDTVTCAADSNCDSVKWYIDGVFQEEDTSAPFQYIWDTTEYSDGSHTVKAEGYNGGVYQCEDSVTVTVDNTPTCLGTTLLSILVLLGSAGIYRRR